MAKVLIIEDDELIRRIYQQIFSLNSHEVLLAANGEDGIALAITEKPAIILLDIMMPKISGLEVLREIKSLSAVAKIPVVILTSLMGTADAEAALASGAIKYIIKSDYTPEEVVSIVDTLLQSYAADKISSPGK